MIQAPTFRTINHDTDLEYQLRLLVTQINGALADIGGGPAPSGGDNPVIGGLTSSAAPSGTPSIGGLDSTST